MNGAVALDSVIAESIFVAIQNMRKEQLQQSKQFISRCPNPHPPSFKAHIATSWTIFMRIVAELASCHITGGTCLDG